MTVDIFSTTFVVSYIDFYGLCPSFLSGLVRGLFVDPLLIGF